MDKKLKIAIIGSRGYPYVYSGYETLVKELSERLSQKGHSVRVYCHRSLFKKKPKYVNGIELIYTPSIQNKFLSQITNSFFSFIHVCFSDTDIILVLNTANGPFGILTKIFRKKTCINVDGLEWLRPKWKGLGSIYFKISSILSTCFFDKIITDSIEMSKVYQKKFNKQSSIIAYGSTINKINNTDFLSKLEIYKNEYYLIVGRLIPDNNAQFIIKSFLKHNTNKKLVIVGDVPYNDKYVNKIKSICSDKIVMTGYVNCQNKLSQLYINCFGYIHGHEFGGTNPTMINALYLNCEVIALKTPFNLEMLKNKKSVFFSKNTSELNEALFYFEKNIEKLKLENINYKIPKKYDWDQIAEQYLEVFYNSIS